MQMRKWRNQSHQLFWEILLPGAKMNWYLGDGYRIKERSIVFFSFVMVVDAGAYC